MVKPVVIYGGGEIGLGVCRRLIDAGVKVHAVIDQCPSKVKKSPVPVMSAIECKKKIGDVLVFISLGNGLAHPEIALDLSRLGYSKILHLPAFLRGKKASSMTRAWNYFYSGGYDITVMDFGDLYKLDADDYILDSCCKFVTAIVHKDYLYTGRRSYVEVEHEYKGYFNWSGYSEEGINYFSDLPIGDEGLKKHLPSALFFNEDQYEFYKRKTYFDLCEYYKEAAPVAVYDKVNHKFNLLDGAHRAFFLERNGFTGIPLRLKKTDWIEYFREGPAQLLMNYCSNLKYLPCPVQHPAFMSFPVLQGEPDNVFLSLLKGVCAR